MPEFDDDKLLSALKKGSLSAYEMLFHKYYKMLCLEAILLLNNKTDAEDLVQNLFIELWDKRIYRTINQSVKAYLYRAVKNRCINENKKYRIASRKLEEYSSHQQIRNVPKWMEQKELANNIQHFLQELPPQRMRAFTLVYIEDKKYQEAADEMGVSINSVKTHLKLALSVLRDKLKAFR